MKTILLFLAVMGLSLGSNSGWSQMVQPLCVEVSTDTQGWIVPGEDNFIKADGCTNKIAECSAIGTRSEGWYVFEKQNIHLMQFADCGGSTLAPQCVFVGTEYEGWVVAGRGLRLYYDKCSKKAVECGSKGTRSEGWYIFTKKPIGLLKYSNCSAYVR